MNICIPTILHTHFVLTKNCDDITISMCGALYSFDRSHNILLLNFDIIISDLYNRNNFTY